MILLKTKYGVDGDANKIRQVYKGNNCYIKERLWGDYYWYNKHIKIVNTVNPGYYINTMYSHSRMTFVIKEVPGVNAKTLGINPKFVKNLVNFVHSNIEETGPFGHGDWALENIMVNGNDMQMIDWDTCDVMSKEEKLNRAYQKLSRDYNRKGLRSFDSIWRECNER